MKIKSFAVLATSSLVAATFMYAVPAMADDMSNGQTMQQGIPTDQNALSQGSDMQNGAISPTDNIGASNTTPSTDEGSPDTATGDDDY